MISVVIPTRDNNVKITLESLSNQTMKPTDIIIVHDKDHKGPNYCRNKGFKAVKTPFVLFSEDDIKWEQNALETLFNSLKSNPECSYSYGSYEMGGKMYCEQTFNAELLQKKNYISTMSLIRSEDFEGFDENIKRLQDWDLWLDMLLSGKTGIFCGKKIFTTFVRNGITYNGDTSWTEAVNAIKRKHKI